MIVAFIGWRYNHFFLYYREDKSIESGLVTIAIDEDY